MNKLHSSLFGRVVPENLISGPPSLTPRVRRKLKEIGPYLAMSLNPKRPKLIRFSLPLKVSLVPAREQTYRVRTTGGNELDFSVGELFALMKIVQDDLSADS